jgi:hypothetical protein
MKLLVGLALMLSTIALALSAIAIGLARDSSSSLSGAQQAAKEFDAIETGMTRAEVAAKLGFPREPLRQCWVYNDHYTLRVCFGKRGRVTQIEKNTPIKLTGG